MSAVDDPVRMGQFRTIPPNRATRDVCSSAELGDRRGDVYITNKNQGMWILRYTGPRPPATNSTN